MLPFIKFVGKPIQTGGAENTAFMAFVTVTSIASEPLLQSSLHELHNVITKVPLI